MTSSVAIVRSRPKSPCRQVAVPQVRDVEYLSRSALAKNGGHANRAERRTQGSGTGCGRGSSDSCSSTVTSTVAIDGSNARYAIWSRPCEVAPLATLMFE